MTATVHKFKELPKSDLTNNDREILRLICAGLTNKEIASRLSVADETIKSNLKRIFKKLDVGNRVQAAVLVTKNGWV